MLICVLLVAMLSLCWLFVEWCLVVVCYLFKVCVICGCLVVRCLGFYLWLVILRFVVSFWLDFYWFDVGYVGWVVVVLTDYLCFLVFRFICLLLVLCLLLGCDDWYTTRLFVFLLCCLLLNGVCNGLWLLLAFSAV